jgi:hypothetical protein
MKWIGEGMKFVCGGINFTALTHRGKLMSDDPKNPQYDFRKWLSEQLQGSHEWLILMPGVRVRMLDGSLEIEIAQVEEVLDTGNDPILSGSDKKPEDWPFDINEVEKGNREQEKIMLDWLDKTQNEDDGSNPGDLSWTAFHGKEIKRGRRGSYGWCCRQFIVPLRNNRTVVIRTTRPAQDLKHKDFIQLIESPNIEDEVMLEQRRNTWRANKDKISE